MKFKVTNSFSIHDLDRYRSDLSQAGFIVSDAYEAEKYETFFDIEISDLDDLIKMEKVVNEPIIIFNGDTYDRSIEIYDNFREWK